MDDLFGNHFQRIKAGDAVSQPKLLELLKEIREAAKFLRFGVVAKLPYDDLISRVNDLFRELDIADAEIQRIAERKK